jgi:serine/threonine protein kinase
MKPLTDNALDRLRTAAELPDLTGTRYRVVSKLGQGGMGSVYCVEDGTLGRQVALKVIALSDVNGEFQTRLLHEARVIAQLEHPGIVPVHDVGTLPDGRMFYTMKLVQGQRLDQHVSTLTTLTERLRLFQRVCEPVAFAHAHGVLHRDLKPSNIMVGPFGEVLVMDWGLSKLLDDSCETNSTSSKPEISTDTEHGAALGTPGYISPEQANAITAEVSYPTDVYSLGAILKFLLEGFDSVPRPLAAILKKCLEQEPSARYASAQDLGSDIGRFLDGRAVSAYPEGPFAKAWRWVLRNQAWLLLIAAYLIMRTLFILWKSR